MKSPWVDGLKRELIALPITIVMSWLQRMVWSLKAHLSSSPSRYSLMFCSNFIMPIKELRNASSELRGQCSGQTSTKILMKWLRVAPRVTVTRSDAKEALLPHDVPQKAWHTLCSDLFYWNNTYYLLVTDYDIKFPVVKKLANTQSPTVSAHLKSIFE